MLDDLSFFELNHLTNCIKTGTIEKFLHFFNRKGISGSAVCAFNLEGVEKSFGGSFQYQENSFTTCEKKEYRDHVGRMCHSNISFDRIEEFQKYMLMHKGVEAMTPGPIHLAQER